MTPIKITPNLSSASHNYQQQRLLNTFRLNKESNKVRYYFDSFDINKMIEGIRSFENAVFAYKNFFEERETLVRALAYFGWLNSQKIGVLAGHQEEVKYFINSSMTPLNIEDKVVNSLFEQVGFSKLDINKATKDQNLDEEIEEVRENSPRLFILNYIIDKTNWLKRAYYLMANQLYIDPFMVSTGFATHDVFKAVYNYYEKMRPSGTKNNFRDALSLYCIYEKLILFKEGKLDELPIYFASAGLMKELKNMPDIIKYFNVEIVNGQTFNVIQDAEFIIWDTLYSNTNNDDKLLDQLVAYEKLREKKDLRGIEYSEQEILTDTNSTIEFQFFEKLLFQNKGKKILADRIKEFIDYKEWISNEKLLTNEKNDIRANLLQRLSDNKMALGIMTKAWSESGLFKKRAKAKNIDFEHYGITNNPFTEFGLTRFSFKNYKAVRYYINNVVLRSLQDENTFLDYRGSFITSLFKALKHPEKENDLEKIIAILCVLGSWSLIEIILKANKNYEKELSLYLVYGVTLLKTTDSHKPIYNCVKGLEEKSFYEKPYKLQIGLSYIYFNWWHKRNGDLELIPELNNKDAIINPEYTDKAIMLLKKALDWLKKEKDKDEPLKKYRNTKYLYALNNYIFYVTRSSASSDFKKLHKFYDIFLKESAIQTEFTYWQNRFEDTLALYYMRLAILSVNNTIDFESYKKRAKKHIDVAIGNGIDDKNLFAVTSSLINKTHEEIKKMIR